MKAIAFTLTAVIAFAFGTAPSFAADDETVAQVDKTKGSILASAGSEGEFTLTELGHRFKPDDRVMVTEGAEVTIKYDNNCDKTYKEPGVYTIDSQCVPAAWFSGKAAAWTAVAALGVYYLVDDDTAARPPVSR